LKPRDEVHSKLAQVQGLQGLHALGHAFQKIARRERRTEFDQLPVGVGSPDSANPSERYGHELSFPASKTAG
jgi:hypothetical protein